MDLILGDCLDVMGGLGDSSIDAVVCDPPYYRVKDDAWDNQWQSKEAFISWIGELCDQWQRILKPNGSLYVFASPRMSAAVEVEIAKWFTVLNNIRWIKDQGWHKKTNKDSLRSYLSPWESIIFAEQISSDEAARGETRFSGEFLYEGLRGYFVEELARAKVSKTQIMAYFEAKGWPKYVTARHVFSVSQWQLPTEDNYARLKECLNDLGKGDYLERDYEYLKREYTELYAEYEGLRRRFEPNAYTEDTWNFDTVAAYKGKHPCEKPVAMMEYIIETSTRQGDVVLDCFAGTGATGVACKRLGREFIGIELDYRYHAEAEKRVGSTTERLWAST